MIEYRSERLQSKEAQICYCLVSVFLCTTVFSSVKDTLEPITQQVIFRYQKQKLLIHIE